MRKHIQSNQSMTLIFIVSIILLITSGPRTAFSFILTGMFYVLTFGIISFLITTISGHRGEMTQMPTSTRGVETKELGMEDFPYAPSVFSKSPVKSPSLGK